MLVPLPPLPSVQDTSPQEDVIHTQRGLRPHLSQPRNFLQTHSEAYLHDGAKPHRADHKLGQAFSETELGSPLQPPALNTQYVPFPRLSVAQGCW